MHELVCLSPFSSLVAMLSLKAGGKGLILPQLNVLGFVDSTWKPLPLGVVVDGVWAVGEAGKAQGGMKRRTVIRM